MTRSPVALRAEKPAQEPPALPALEGATIAGEVDSIPSLRALSVKSDGGDAALDDGPTPPPVSRSHRASERAPAAAATGGRRSRWGGGTVWGIATAAAVLLGGLLVWQPHRPAGEQRTADQPLTEPPAQDFGATDSETAEAPAPPREAAPAPLVEDVAVAAPTPTTAPGGGPDEERLGLARSWARSHALACHRGGRAVGDVTLTVTFAPSGRVSQLEMRGEPVASAPVGRCVADFYRAMLVPAFEGEPFTFSEELTLR